MKLTNIYLDRPYVILSAAMSLDGYLATLQGDTKLSSKNDWIRVHKLRSECDAIMVGGETIRKDDSKLTVNEKMINKKVKKHPIRIVVSSNCNIPLNARVITYKSDIPTIIATTTNCPREKEQKFESIGCKIIKCGNKSLVDLSYLLKIIKNDFNVNKLILEGGGQLNGEMLAHQLIDEIQLAIAPVICGDGIPFFKLQKPYPDFSDSPFFDIIAFNKIDDMIWIKLAVQNRIRKIR